MKRILNLILLIPLYSFSQDRTNSELPIFTDTLGTIKSATGWMKNDVGKWVSKPNAIPYENSGVNFSCSDFSEYSLLKVSYKEEFYFCLLEKAKSQSRFWIFNFFKKEIFSLTDTIFRLSFQPICQGDMYKIANFKAELVNEIFKSFEGERYLSETNTLAIDLSLNRVKNYLRFFISDLYSNHCGDSEDLFAKRYFETKPDKLSFFENLISSE